MRYLFLLIVFITSEAQSQHCPWDCSGLFVMQTNLTPAELSRMKPVLVDENKTVVIDTIYGTGGRTWDTSYLLPFAEFQHYRTSRIAQHRWYAYDTMYAFAREYTVAKINYCKFAHSGRKLSLRFTLHPPGLHPVFKYIDIAGKGLLHLHDYNIQLNKKDTAATREEIASKVFVLQRSELGLR